MLRIVKDGAKETTSIDGEYIAWLDMDTIEVNTHWTAEEAAVLLGMSLDVLYRKYNDYVDEVISTNSEPRKGFELWVSEYIRKVKP